MRQMRRLLVALVFALLVPAASLMAQRLTGSASVQVLDPTGKAVSDTKAVVSNSDRGVKLTLTSSSEGVVTVPDLPPGDYKITLQHEGFKTTTATVTIRVGVTTSLDITMELGAVSSSVIVEASAQTADTSQSTVQGVIQSQQIESLPLNGRNFLDLAQQAPGVQIVDGGLFDPTKNQMVGVSVGGRSGRSTRIQVDGVDITDETVGTTVMNLTNESIQEFGIQQSSLDPSTDLTSSGAVNIITKSGTNTIHGSGFGLWRRSDFAASNAPTILVNPAKPPFSRDNYGGQLGGPFIKDKWFWQAEYEKVQQIGANTTAVPQFPQFTGAFGVPVDDRSGGGRTDFNLTQNQHLFYRFNHNDNIGVTGFGGVVLAAFANSNIANSHVAGWDYSKGNWVHSIRFSRLKFLNRIVQANALAGTPVTLGPNGESVEINVTGLGGFLVGPSLLAPQATFQQNRQLKYDGSLIHGKHTFKFGVEYNRIDENGFASFFANGPLIAGPYGKNRQTPILAAVPFNANGPTDPLNFPFKSVTFGNGLGFGSEKPSLGLPFGGFINNRFGIYAHDTWRITRNFTVNAGLRYDRDDGLTNHDLARDPLISVFDPELGGNPRNDNMRFAPKAGFAWDVKSNGKFVIRGGAGIYYETNIFNNILFDRTLNIQPGLGFAGPLVNGGSGGGLIRLPDPRNAANILFDINTSCGGTCIGKSIGSVIPVIAAAQQAYQQASAELAAGFPQAGVPIEFESDRGTDTIGGSLIDPHYRSPYGAQFNIGFQRELKRGLVLSVDYVLNRGVHFNMTRDRNRQGAANNFNLAAAQAAIAATLGQCGAATIDQAIASCDANDGDPADIFNFSGNGLGSGSGRDGVAFGGNKRDFRTMTVIEQIGLSRYQGLQVALTGKLGNWGPFSNTFVNGTYSLSRFKSTGGAGGLPGSTDQDFLTASQNNDFPTRFYGPSNLDRTHIFGVSFITDLPWHFRLASTTAYRSAESSDISLFDDTTGNPAAIFLTDLNGDGVVADPLPGTNHGSFDRGVDAKKLARMVANFNNTIAGGLTPAGQALVDAGLFTPAQLTALGGVIPQVPLGALGAGQVNNPNFFTSDLRLSWRYKVKERLTIEPMAEVFNFINRDNHAGTGSGNTALSGQLSGQTGTINGSDTPPLRIGQGSGSFSTGSPRAFQFGIRVTF